ncbi:FecR family protein [Runella zeae]|uniref:FecR family protein n=1 Tax=Runella zeae TaxID=94255 RepID=UPI0023576DD8|nr:FecR family protein [Runella zeae]
MTQQEFNDISKRYLEGKTTEEEERFLEEWFQNQPTQYPVNVPENQRKNLEKRIWRQIHAQIRPVGHIIQMPLTWVSGAAACLLVGVLWWHSLEPPPQVASTAELSLPIKVENTGIEVKNTTELEQEVRLEDGTVVLLKQNSSIVYDKTFNRTKRTVYLKGQAFFKVKRDVKKPFVVHTGDLTTEVLGTSFWVSHHEKSNTIEVSVTTGKVSVYTEKPNQKSEKNGVILTPNQKVLYDVVSKNIVPGIVENPVPIVAPEVVNLPFVFKETCLQEVLDALSLRYGVEFVIANPSAKDCKITADLNGLSMFTQLELICKSIDATYEKRGTVVFINGDGC